MLFWSYPDLVDTLKSLWYRGRQEVSNDQQATSSIQPRVQTRVVLGLITDKGYSIAEASWNLGIDYSVLHRLKKQYQGDPQFAFPGERLLKSHDEELRQLKRKLERVQKECNILKKALVDFAEHQK